MNEEKSILDLCLELKIRGEYMEDLINNKTILPFEKWCEEKQKEFLN